jgi:hypothetical protein
MHKSRETMSNDFGALVLETSLVCGDSEAREIMGMTASVRKLLFNVSLGKDVNTGYANSRKNLFLVGGKLD